MITTETPLQSGERFFADFFEEVSRRLRDASDESLHEVCRLLATARGHKVILAGNGASAAIASHVAVDLTKSAGIRAMNFNEPDLITCLANDYGYDQWLVRGLEMYADRGDVIVLISSSGQSSNIVNAARHARGRGLPVIALSGFNPDNSLRQLGDISLWVDSRRYNIVETVHQSWLLAAVDHIVECEAAS
jgi:D-sedoheptulose 7-phosphate isomerase